MCVFSLHELFHNHLSARCPLTTSKIILSIGSTSTSTSIFSLLLCFSASFASVLYALYIVYSVLKSNSFWLNMHIVCFTIHNSFLLRRLSRCFSVKLE